MHILIKNAKIIDPTSSFFLQKTHLWIANGTIQALGDDVDLLPEKTPDVVLKAADYSNWLAEHSAENAFAEASFFMVIEAEGCSISPGWFDLKANFGFPEFDYREDAESLARTALAGGFTGAAVYASGRPYSDDVAAFELLQKKLQAQIPDFLPVMGVSKNNEHQVLSELMELEEVGTKVFGDLGKTISDTAFLKRLMQYSRGLDAPLLLSSQDSYLSQGGQMNEGKANVELGLKGIPKMAETIALFTQLQLLNYTQSKVHFTALTLAESFEKVKTAAQNGLAATASCSIFNLGYTDEGLSNYDTYLKQSPPLRDGHEQKQLIEALLSGKVDAIISNHQPLEEDLKNCEFEYAQAGSISLQTFFPMLLAAVGRQNFEEKLIPILVENPRKILGLTVPKLQEGCGADLILLDFEQKWTLDDASNQSKSSNSPLWGKSLKGKVLGGMKQNRLF